MGHRNSPEESGRAGAVCGCDGGVAAADREPVVENSLTGAQYIAPLQRTPVRLALFALRFYKAYLSMLFAGSCRFEPTCSQYSYEAIERFGVARGCWLTLKRLARCQPLSRKFGIDPVPENWEESSSEAPAQDVRHSICQSICDSGAASHEVHS
jgi:putative membrane protein insertion efficiency factor